MSQAYGLGHGGEYQPYAMTIPVDPTPVTGVRFFQIKALASTAAFVKVDFSGVKHEFTITETGGAQSVSYSFDGSTVHGTIAASGSKSFQNMAVNGIWIKNGDGVATVTIEAWVGRIVL